MEGVMEQAAEIAAETADDTAIAEQAAAAATVDAQQASIAAAEAEANASVASLEAEQAAAAAAAAGNLAAIEAAQVIANNATEMQHLREGLEVCQTQIAAQSALLTEAVARLETLTVSQSTIQIAENPPEVEAVVTTAEIPPVVEEENPVVKTPARKIRLI